MARFGRRTRPAPPTEMEPDILPAIVKRLRRAWPEVPYPGLRSFEITKEADESLIFFGREVQIYELLDRLHESQFVAVVGPSGCGKSSLVKVGVIPHLEAGRIYRAGSKWITAVMEPGGDPFGGLTESLEKAFAEARAAGFNLRELPREQLQRPTGEARRWDGLARLGESLSSPDTSGLNLLLLVDQFEELFRPDLTRPEVAADFINLLLNVYNAGPKRLYLIVTMRTDYLEQCAYYKGLPEVMNKTQYLVPGLNREEVRAAIEQPACLGHYNGAVHPDLLRQLLDDFDAGPTYDPDRLPLMQHMLVRLWRKTEPVDGRRVLTKSLYEIQGGLQNGLALHVNWIFKGELDERGRNIAEAMLRSLVRSGPTGKPVRRVATIEEIKEIADVLVRRDGVTDHGPISEEEIRKVAHAFARPGRSFVRWKGPNQLDVTHESFIRQWPEIDNKWAPSERQIERESRLVQEQAEQYAAHKRPLLRDWEWQRVQQVWNTHPPTPLWAKSHDLNLETIDPFLAESRKDINLRQAFRRGALGVLMVALIFAAIALVYYSRLADHRRIDAAMAALGGQVKEASFPQQAAAIGAEALNIAVRTGRELAPSAETHVRAQLSRAFGFSLSGPSLRRYEWEFKPPLEWAFVPQGSGAAALFDLSNWPDPQPTDFRILLSGHNLARLPMETCHEAGLLAANTDLLATGGRDGYVRLYNLRSGDPSKQALDEVPLPARDSQAKPGAPRITGVAFTPQCDVLAVATVSGGVFFFRVSGRKLGTPIEVAGRHEGPVTHFQMAKTRPLLVSGGEDGQVLIWDLSTVGSMTVRPRRLLGTEKGISAFDVAADGAWVVAAGRAQKSPILWKTDGAALNDFHGVALEEHREPVTNLKLTPDGRKLISTSQGGEIRLWRLLPETGAAERLDTSNIGKSSVQYAIVSPDSRWVAASDDGPLFGVWNIAGDTLDTMPISFRHDPFTAAAFSPDSRRLLTGSWQKFLYWELRENGSAPSAFVPTANDTSPDGWVTGVAFQSDSVAVVGSLSQVSVFHDLGTAAETWSGKGHDSYVTSFAFSQDGRWLVSGSQDGQTIVSALAAHLHIQPLIFRSPHGVALDPSELWLANGDKQGTHLWRLDGDDLVRKSTTLPAGAEAAADGETTGVHFSPNGRWLAAGNDRGQILFWDVRRIEAWRKDPNAKPTPVVVESDGGYVAHVEFSADGQFLGVRFAGGGGRLWRVSDSAGLHADRIGLEEKMEWIAFDPKNRYALWQSADEVDWAPLPAKGVTLNGKRKLLDRGPGHEKFEGFVVSPDGERVAGANPFREIRVWRTGKPDTQPIRVTAHELPVEVLAFSPDSQWLASGDAGGHVYLHDLGGYNPRQRPLELRRHNANVSAIAFSPDGRKLATASSDGILVSDFKPHNVGEPVSFGKPGSSPDRVEFSNSGKLLVVTNFGTQIYDLNIRRLLETACRVAGRNLTHREWTLYMRDARYERACPQFPEPEY
jgi:WD40 repeat protein